MKKHLLIISMSIAIIALASCGRNTKLMTKLDAADRLMENRPDSALSLLAGLKDSVRDGSKSVQMRYELMKTEAEDKCYITHTSDSTMLVNNPSTKAPIFLAIISLETIGSIVDLSVLF